MNINFNASGLFNIVTVILTIIMLILLSACGQREHIRDMQAEQVFLRTYKHNCVVNDEIICDSMVTGEKNSKKVNYF